MIDNTDANKSHLLIGDNVLTSGYIELKVCGDYIIGVNSDRIFYATTSGRSGIVWVEDSHFIAKKIGVSVSLDNLKTIHDYKKMQND